MVGMGLIDENNLPRLARKLANQDTHLSLVIERYGPPPLWAREPGFATLLRIILEQQVSLASARACFDKLCRRVGELTPLALFDSTDTALKTDGFSRQKIGYARHLAEAVLSNRFELGDLCSLSDTAAKAKLIELKGVGEWTSEIYLLMALRRPDVMPKGDIALHTAWHRISGGPRPSVTEFLEIARRWRPYRSVAARMLWHFYLKNQKNG